MARRLVVLMLVAAMAVPLAACGRKGRTIPPEGSVFPRTYPEITFPEAKPTPPEGSFYPGTYPDVTVPQGNQAPPENQ